MKHICVEKRIKGRNNTQHKPGSLHDGTSRSQTMVGLNRASASVIQRRTAGSSSVFLSDYVGTESISDFQEVGWRNNKPRLWKWILDELCRGAGLTPVKLT